MVRVIDVFDVGGVPHVVFSHDASQGVAGGQQIVDSELKDTDGDGRLDVVRMAADISFAMAESPVNKTIRPGVLPGGYTGWLTWVAYTVPAASEWSLVAMGAVGLAGAVAARRRRRRVQAL